MFILSNCKQKFTSLSILVRTTVHVLLYCVCIVVFCVNHLMGKREIKSRSLELLVLYCIVISCTPDKDYLLFYSGTGNHEHGRQVTSLLY